MRDLVRVFEDLTENAQAFMAGIARSVEVQQAEAGAVVGFKKRLIDYLERFIGNLVSRSGAIAQRILALGARCAPPICTDGMPGAAPRTLLSQLARAGARLHYHGDFDWPGLAIGNRVMRTCGARPWRYRAADYLAAIQAVPVRGRALGPDSVEAEWDADLSSAMRAHDRAVDEEAIAAVLVEDLEHPAG